MPVTRGSVRGRWMAVMRASVKSERGCYDLIPEFEEELLEPSAGVCVSLGSVECA
eukprot:NODE_25083_length_600_cov_2.646934.p3 GENE.NODE_25083_length_600_cov_2.646934~~NODE_25083_length_600_cov_2.646934.p3  ORF type:complete len:55 (+),score=6.16 NODE_25083_length_600_cov_2.646934:268-432(+)